MTPSLHIAQWLDPMARIRLRLSFGIHAEGLTDLRATHAVRRDFAVQEITAKVPEPHQQVFEAIDTRVCWLHLLWNTYRQLFGDVAKVELLNRAAPGWAKVQQDVLLEGVMLGLTRLTDRLETGGRQNLVLERLKELASKGNVGLSREVDDAVVSAKKACDVLRKHRDKRLAHPDLEVSLDSSLLPPFSRESIEAALEKVRELMNKLNHHFRGGATMYEDTFAQGDAECLMECIEDGLKFRFLRRNHGKLTEPEVRDALQTRALRLADLQKIELE